MQRNQQRVELVFWYISKMTLAQVCLFYVRYYELFQEDNTIFETVQFTKLSIEAVAFRNAKDKG